MTFKTASTKTLTNDSNCTKGASAIIKGFLKADISHMNGPLKAAGVGKFLRIFSVNF
jgi:hypothetical protein